MNLAQQQGYFARALLHKSDTHLFPHESDTHLEDLGRATLHVDYTLPGWFRWSPSRREDRPWPVREQTREAALQAASRIDPQATAEQIVPTALDVTILYMPRPGAGPVHLVNAHNDGFL
jgi:hypothetical protein